MSTVVQHRVAHQALWLCCAPAPFCPRWRSVSGARLPLAPGLSAAPLGFDCPAAPSHCFPWWTSRAAMMAGQRSVASHCALGLCCYDCRGGGEKKSKCVNQDLRHPANIRSDKLAIRATKTPSPEGSEKKLTGARNKIGDVVPIPSQSSPGVKVWVLWRCAGGLRWGRGLQRGVTVEASCPW